MALLVGELKSVLDLDTKGFDKGLSTSEAKFKRHGKALGSSAKDIAKQAETGLGAVEKSSFRLQGTLGRIGGVVGRASVGLGGFAKGAGIAGVAIAGVAGAVVGAGIKVGDYAGRLELLKKKSATVFGGELGRVQSWAAENARAMGLTKGEATGLAAGLGDLLIPMGFTRKAAADMSTATVGLSGALAEWSGGTKSAAEVTEILSAAFMGERDGLNALGISITQAEVDAALLAAGQENLTGKQLQQAEATATQKLIMEKSTDAQKAYADGAGSLARESAEARAKLKEMGETLATKAAPALLKIATFVNNDVIPALSKAGGVAKKLVDEFNELPAPVKFGTVTLAGFVTVAAGVAFIVNKSIIGIGDLKDAFQALGSTGKFLTVSLGAVGLALAAAAAIYSVFAQRNAEAKRQADDLRATLDEQTGAITGNTRAYVANEMATSGMAESAKSFGLNLAQVTDAALGNQAAMDAVSMALNQVIDQNAVLSNGEISGDLIVQSEAAQKLKDQIFGLNGGLTEAQKQQKLTEEGTKASTTATAAQTTVAGQAASALALKAAADKKAAEAAAAHEKEINDQIAAMLKMPGLVLSLRDAQRGWQAAVDSASESLKENGKTLDNTTPKGRANQEALDAMANSANDVTKSMIENGQSNLSVVRTYEQNRAGLIATARQFGLNSKQAQAYADKVLAIPPRSNTTLKADITDLQAKLKTAKSKLNDKDLTKTRKAELKAKISQLEAGIRTAQQKINGLKGKTVVIKYTSAGVSTWTARRTEKGVGMATGGPVEGPGGPTDDRVPIMASNNEHMWTAREVAAAGGHSAVQRMRRAALAGRGFAAGGLVNVNLIKQGVFRSVAEGVAHLNEMFAGGGTWTGGGGLGRQIWRGKRLNGRTIQMILAAEKILGAAFRITQGSWSTSVAASGGTHAGGGVIDTNGPRGWAAAVRALRRVGFAAWHRTPSQGPWNHHIHSVALGDPTASPSAKRQMASFRAGRSGLGYRLGTPYVPRDGLGYLHKGEEVITADENRGKGSRMTKLDPDTIDALARAEKKAFAEVMREAKFRVVGGGGGGSYILQMSNG